MKLTIKGHPVARILFSFQNLKLLKTKSVRKSVPVPPTIALHSIPYVIDIIDQSYKIYGRTTVKHIVLLST